MNLAPLERAIGASNPRPKTNLRSIQRLRAFIVCCGALTVMLWEAHAQPQLSLTNETSNPELSSASQRSSVWENGVGEGFRASAQSVSLSVGATGGLAIFGGRQSHDLALASLSYGHMLSHVLAEGHWYRGNPELRVETFTGAQFSPETQWFVGLTPHLRYNFATGTRWIPYFDAGAGVTATGIRPPDLGGTFEFNLQVNGGIHWFVKDNLALTLEAGIYHWSDAGINKSNLGVNGIKGLLGLTFFF